MAVTINQCGKRELSFQILFREKFGLEREWSLRHCFTESRVFKSGVSDWDIPQAKRMTLKFKAGHIVLEQ